MDSSFFLGLCHPKDTYHKMSVRILKESSKGIYGLIYTSPYVIAETATLILIRTQNNNDIIEKFYDLIFGNTRIIRVLDWNKTVDEESWLLFKNHNKTAKAKQEYLSFVDATNIVFCRNNEIDKIAAFDGDFKPYLNVIS